jgi:hypothetical protein
MRVFLQLNETASVFSEQSLDIGNGKATIENSTGFITLPSDFGKTIYEKSRDLGMKGTNRSKPKEHTET